MLLVNVGLLSLLGRSQSLVGFNLCVRATSRAACVWMGAPDEVKHRQKMIERRMTSPARVWSDNSAHTRSKISASATKQRRPRQRVLAKNVEAVDGVSVLSQQVERAMIARTKREVNDKRRTKRETSGRRSSSERSATPPSPVIAQADREAFRRACDAARQRNRKLPDRWLKAEFSPEVLKQLAAERLAEERAQKKLATLTERRERALNAMVAELDYQGYQRDAGYDDEFGV